MRLLERDDILQQLTRLRSDMEAGRGRVALLQGEAGAGKTALARAFLEQSTGDRVFRTQCDDFSVPDALGPLYDLFREAGRPLARDDAPQHYALFNAACAMLQESGQPTIVLLEDVHWADDATIDFIRFLARRISDKTILLVLTSRSEGAAAQQRLRRALSDLPLDSVVRINVPALSPAAVEHLASDTGIEPRQLHALTGGNAFFVTEVLLGGPGSQSAHDTVLARVDRLPPAARSALEMVAVFPRAAERDVLAALAVDKAALDETVELGLLERTPQSYAFRHEIARQAVEQAMAQERRRALNSRVLDVLHADRGQPVARLAHHAAQAEDSAAILLLAPQAARWAAATGAHRQAARHLENAVAVSPDNATLLRGLAIELHMVGRLDDAIAIEQRALAVHRQAGNVLEQGASLRWLSRFSYLAGRRRDADTYGDAAVAVLAGSPPGAELAMAFSNQSQLAMLAECEEDALIWGQKALDLAQRLDRHDIICAVLNNMGSAQRWTSLQKMQELMQRSLSLALEHQWHEHAARAYTNRGCVEADRRQHGAAMATLEAGIAFCRERDLDTLRLYMQGWLARICLLTGEWERAQAEAHSVLRNEMATPLARFQALDTIARLRLRRGDPAADEPLSELEQFLVNGREFQRLAPYATLLAERAWVGEGDPAEAVALLDEALSLSPHPLASEDLTFWKSVITPGAGGETALMVRYTEYEMPFEAAVAQTLAGNMENARRAFERLGAGRFADVCRKKLASSGKRGPRQSTRQNSAGLTTREVDVLRNIAEGLSNKEIALKLQIAPKTVDHHVSAIIGKVGGGSRGRAAALARQLGLI